MMINTILSDLYFNHEHPAYDKFMQECPDDEPVDFDKRADAIVEDTKVFLTAYEPILMVSCSPEELANDFAFRM
jgi:hypothetical protein